MISFDSDASLPSRGAVTRAGKQLRDRGLEGIDEEALETIKQWRGAHSYPLSVVYQTLRNRAKETSGEAVVSSRLKRLPSIQAKLKRGAVHKLGEMQDFAGCRAVMENLDQVEALRNTYGSKTRTKYFLKSEDDYIALPKADGYRGRHLVVQFKPGNKHAGIMVEIQLRTQRMHQWSTAVEIVDTFKNSSLKGGAQVEGWSRFFLLTSALIALEEGTPVPEGAPKERRDVIDELKGCGADTCVEQLRSYARAVKADSGDQAGRYFVVMIDTLLGYTLIRGYKGFSAANEEYTRLERKLSRRPEANVVLVDTDSAASLRRAYPNYFADTSAFTTFLSEQLGLKTGASAPGRGE